MPLIRYMILLAVTFFSAPALTHSVHSASLQEQLSAGLSAALLAIFWVVYLRGARLKPPLWQLALCFHTALFICVLAVLGPLDEWAETSAAAHMSQHMFFMVVIAPLWVISRPLPQFVAGGGSILFTPLKAVLRFVSHPMMTAYLHGLVIWFWHLPYFYNLALYNPWWHIFEHACFLITAGLFWWSVLKSTRYHAPFALLAVLFTLMHTGFLGALLTFAQVPLYGEVRNLADQQLAGLIMWVVGGIPYILATVWISHRWYRQLRLFV